LDNDCVINDFQNLNSRSFSGSFKLAFIELLLHTIIFTTCTLRPVQSINQSIKRHQFCMTRKRDY